MEPCTGRSLISLPMYDQPFVRASTDLFFLQLRQTALARSCSDGGSTQLHEQLSAMPPTPHRVATDDQTAAECSWDNPRLLLSQTCGQSLHAGLDEKLSPLAAPIYDCFGCESCFYCGLVIVRKDSTFGDLPSLSGAALAVNSFDSYSGCIGLQVAVSIANL